MQLNSRALEHISAYSAGVAESYGVADASKYFALQEPQEIALRDAMLESVEFLDMIFCGDVDQLSGQVIMPGSSALYTGRRKNGRFSRHVGVKGNDYHLVETDSCAALRWDTLSVSARVMR